MSLKYWQGCDVKYREDSMRLLNMKCLGIKNQFNQRLLPILARRIIDQLTSNIMSGI